MSSSRSSPRSSPRSRPQTGQRTPPRGLSSRTTLRLGELTFQDRDGVFHAPRGADWFWLALFAVVMLGSGFYAWQQLGFDNDLGRAAFFAALLVAILWAALIYTFKLSASVAVGPRSVSLVRGPWRSELSWAEVARLEERVQAAGRHRLRWLVVIADDGREMRIREDMVSSYPQFRAEVVERQRLWVEHGGTWGASGGGPFSEQEQVANLVTWWLIAAGACLLPGLYFALLLPDTFGLGIALVGLAALAALVGLWVSLRRQTFVVSRRSVVAQRPLGRTTLAWGEITKVERVDSRRRMLVRVGILLARAILLLVARADSRVDSFTWSPRVPEYLVLRGMGGRQIRVRLHRLASPDELMAWIEFYDNVARQAPSRPLGQAQPASPPPQAPEVPDLASSAGPQDPWAGTRGGEMAKGQSGAGVAHQGANPANPTANPNAHRGANPARASGPETPSTSGGNSVDRAARTSQAQGPRVTKPVLGGSVGDNSESNVDQIDPRILAVLQDVEALEGSKPAGAPDPRETQRAGRSDWLNESLDQPLFAPPKLKRPPVDDESGDASSS